MPVRLTVTTGLTGFPVEYLSALGRGMAVGAVAVGAVAVGAAAVGATADEAITVGAGSSVGTGSLADAGLLGVRLAASTVEPAADFMAAREASMVAVASTAVVAVTVAAVTAEAGTGNRHPIRSPLIA
ncbi:MAG: hypothetical protein ACLP56_07805 [Candidatus Sulfotelmatobacter sp.]